MGWETAIFLGLNLLSGIQSQKEGKAAAKATIEEGNIASRNKALDIKRKTASQTVSFLNSGLTLDGTPRSVINSTFNVGLEDLGQIKKNYNSKAKNQMAAGRTEAINKLASAFSDIDLGGSSIPNPFGGAPLGGDGSWLDMKLGGSWAPGSTDLGDQMPWLSNDPNDILVGKV